MDHRFVGIQGDFGQSSIPYDELESRLDEGIKEAVRILMQAGIPTIESCEGGEGHAWGEPTIRFQGGPEMGFLAYAIAIHHNLPVSEIRRCWRIVNHEVTGPDWEISLSPQEINRCGPVKT